MTEAELRAVIGNRLSLTNQETEAIGALVRDSMHRNEIRGEHEEKVWNWLQSLLLDIGLLANLCCGHADVSWSDEDDSPSWRLTESGIAAADKLIRENGLDA